MRKTAIIGVGMTAVSEHWGLSISDLATEAFNKTIEDAKYSQVDALYVANAYGSTFNYQSQMAPMIADYVGLRGIEAYTIEAGSASGGVAIRTAHLAVASGMIDCAVVIGVEKATDIVGSARTKALNISIDAEYEGVHGATLPALAGLLMRRYMHEYGVAIGAFEGFTMNAHANGKRNPLAMYRNTIKSGSFANAPMVAEPVSLFDSAPDGDGAAAIMIMPLEKAEDVVSKPIQIIGSGVATDSLALQDRANILRLDAVSRATEKAMREANVAHADIDLLELHDAFTILSTLSLEASGFAEMGQGYQYADNGGSRISLGGELPISTFGGLKSRGNPHGASGVYQAVEASLQIRQEAGDNQVAEANTAMIQSIGGLGSTAVTHILRI